MPQAIQLITYFIPARYFIVILRGLYLKGNGFYILWPQLAVLCVIGAIVVTIAVKKFKKKIV
jgi:ABC-2 type transport system permease protein